MLADNIKNPSTSFFGLSTPDAASWGKATNITHAGLEALPQPLEGLPVFDDHIYVYDRDELIKMVKAAGLRTAQ